VTDKTPQKHHPHLGGEGGEQVGKVGKKTLFPTSPPPPYRGGGWGGEDFGGKAGGGDKVGKEINRWNRINGPSGQ
jgi:hypothetical protein